ncbi:MAG: polyprenol phosphomannose-dependent alpha 1,6 mannosyltransferase MptB [Solirubrobacteraceae bacterium]
MRARFPLRSRVGLAAVALVPLLGLLICVAATRTNVLLPQGGRPIPNFLTGPFRYIGFHLPAGAVIAVILLMVAAYVLAVLHVGRVSTRAVVLAVVAFNLIVLIAPPLFSTDVFSYQAYARLFAIHHMNPYTHGPAAMPPWDAILRYAGQKWINTPSVYGPLFTIASGALAGASVAFSMFGFKLAAALSSFGILTLTWRSARIRGVSQRRAIALFGLNPLVTLYGVGGAHNDLLMLLFLAAALYALLRGRYGVGGAAIIVAAAMKLTGGVLFPFALVAGHGQGGVRRLRLRLIAGAALTLLAAMIPSFLVFGAGLLKLPGTLESVQSKGQWQSIPGFLVNLTGNGKPQLVALALGLIFACGCLWLIWRVWTGRMDWIEGAAWATVGMLLTAGLTLPWYVSWLFPLVGLTTSRRLLIASLWITGILTVIAVVMYLPGWPPSIHI